jgi:hypothetical protein
VFESVLLSINKLEIYLLFVVIFLLKDNLAVFNFSEIFSLVLEIVLFY